LTAPPRAQAAAAGALALLLVAAAPAATLQTRTQAGCACLPAWRDRQGGEHNGCAQPDGDAAVRAAGGGRARPRMQPRMREAGQGSSAGSAAAVTRRWARSRCHCVRRGPHAQGMWCAVDPATCQGYYSFFTASSGATVFYDYCSDVRGEWAVPGGEPHGGACLRLILPPRGR
jgi:hypothetical protein